MGIAENEINVLDTSVEAMVFAKSLVTQAMQTALKPLPKLNLVEWADKYRYLPSNSAESGRWKTSRVEVARQPMLSITADGVQEVTVMCCVQLAKTELMLNAMLYYMHQEPSPIMYVAPKKETAEAFSKERVVQSVNVTPVLKDIFSGNRRDQGNTITQKQFAGGQLSIVSARNPTDLAMRAVKIVLLDEVDKYPMNAGAGEGGSGGEGDPCAIVWARSTTYGKRARKIMACSPTVQGKSRIEAEYFKSNMSIFLQPCKHCNHEKQLTWLDVHIPRIKNEKGADEFDHLQAAIKCSNCNKYWNESDRHYSIRNGYWKATKPEVTWHHGYKVSALASPFLPIVALAKEFKDAQGNPELLKAFYNTRMAETWKEVGEQPDWERLYERREKYPMSTVQKGGLLVTCGIDVQKDYLVYEVVAWGRKKESWSVEKGVIQGSIEEDDTKQRLAEFLDRTFPNHAGVQIPIMKTNLDSGYNTQECYSFCRSYGSDSCVPIKGEDGLKTVVGTPRPVDVMHNGKRMSRGIMLWGVGSSIIKEQVYRWLNAKKPTDEMLAEGKGYPTGYSHFPEYDEEFFKQLTAEQYIIQTDNRGFHKHVWEKLRKDNHFLDCRVYARSAAAMLQIDRMSDSDWDALEMTYTGVVGEVEKTDEPEQLRAKVPEQRKKRQSSWMNR